MKQVNFTTLDYKILNNTLIITTTNEECYVFNTKELNKSDLSVLKKFFDNLLTILS